MCIHFGGAKVVHSKSSDKHESSQTLRVALNKSCHRLILRYIGDKGATYVDHVDAW